jgi:hypothetical protein
MRSVGLPWQAAFLSKVPNLPTVVARVPHWCGLLWWPSCPLLLRSERSAVVLLLLELQVVAPKLWSPAWLSRGWRVDHAVLQWSTATTTSGGSWHGPLLFLYHRTSIHGALLINGGAGQVVVRQAQILNQAVLQLDIEPLAIELGLLSISVNMVPTVLCQVVKLLSVVIHRTVPLTQF